METIRKIYIIISIIAIMAILANGVVGTASRVLEAKADFECEMKHYHTLMEEVRSECFSNSNS